MGNTLPPLASSVVVGSTAYRAGDIPPLKHAKKITNKRNWEGGETPDFENGDFEDGAETVDGVGNSDAANAARTGLPGFGEDSRPKQLVTETTDDKSTLLKRTDREGAGQGEGQGDGGQGDGGEDDDDEEGGSGDGAGQSDGGTTGFQGAAATATTPVPDPPAAARTARKATKPAAQ